MSSALAIAPKSVKLRGEGNTIEIEWSDDHRSAYPYQFLRDRCPCATCGGRVKEKSGAIAGPQAPLPLYETRLRPGKAELVGRYALQIFWNDGHTTGIYTFDYLRELCPCAECVSQRQ